MERASIGPAEFEYEIAGSGEPVVFIHGAFIADAFRPLLAEPTLTSRYRLLLYRRRGYLGSSPATTPLTVGREAEDCRALLHHLGIERAHIAGHSFGGAVALQLALDVPAVVQSLALIEPALMVGASGAGYRAALARSIERYRDAGAAVVVDEFLEARSPGYRPKLDRLLPRAFDQAVADAPTSFEGELPGLLEWRFGEAEARRVSQPLLSLLGGESSALSPRFEETHRLLLAWAPHAEGTILPGATHFPQIEDPRRLAEALAAFWTRHPLPAGRA